MYNIIDTAESMAKVLEQNGGGIKNLINKIVTSEDTDALQPIEETMIDDKGLQPIEEKIMEEEVIMDEPIVDEEPLMVVDAQTGGMVYNTQGGIGMLFGGASGNSLSPFNNQGTLQFAIAIFMIVLFGILFIMFFMNIFIKSNFSIPRLLQLVIFGVMILAYSFDVNDKMCYNLIKFFTIPLLTGLLFLKGLTNHGTILLMGLLSVIVLFMILGMLPIESLSGLSLEEDESPKEKGSRSMIIITISLLLMAKAWNMYSGSKDFLGDIEMMMTLKESDSKVAPAIPAKTVGGKKKRRYSR